MAKENNLDKLSAIEEINTKIWSVFEVLRIEPIVPDDYYVILLLLSAQKDDLLAIDFLSDKKDPKPVIIEKINNDNKLFAEYKPILEVFKPILKRISDQALVKIITILGSLNQKILAKNFPDIFDRVLYRISESQGKLGGEFIQPVELTRFICALANVPENSRVFNPFAGLASFGVYLDQGQEYFGQEINQKTWALGTLRIMAYDRPGVSEYIFDDSILHWPDHSEKFDLILANPPYGMRLNQKYREIEPDMRSIEQFLIEKGTNSLNEKGKLIALLPQGILFRGMSEQRLRQQLIEEDLIDTVVSLPGGLLLNTGIPLVVIVIDKDKKMPGKVRFVDAKKFVESKSPREKVLNDYRLSSIVNGSNKDSDTIKIIDIEQIREFDYYLNVSRYFQKQIEGIRLKEMVENVRGRRNDFPEEGKMIRIGDLKDDKVDFKLNLSEVEDTKLTRPHLRLIDESCLLLATRWKTIKPTFFEFQDKPIFLNPDIVSLKVNEAIVDTAYLVNELHSDYVQEQLDSYRLGTTIPFIRREDLHEVIIKVPSLIDQQRSIDLQKAKMKGIIELSDRIKNLQKERNALAHGMITSQFNEFASLKHTLGRPRQNILDWTDNLIHFLSEKHEGFDKLNNAFQEFYESDILSALQEIKRDVNFITEVLEKGENGFLVEEFDKTFISLTEINNLIAELSSISFNFKLKKFLLKGEKMKERGIQGNKILLKTLIDNLLTNAHKYGFDLKREGNEVIIELKEVEDFLSMEVRNNGKPFPKNLDREKFITKYSTADVESGTGLGGYDIHRIAIEFNNPDWELNLNMDPIYPVKFKFQFPIKLVN